MKRAELGEPDKQHWLACFDGSFCSACSRFTVLPRLNVHGGDRVEALLRAKPSHSFGIGLLHQNRACAHHLLVLQIWTVQRVTLCTLTGGANGSSMLWLRFHRPSSPLMLAVTNNAGCFGDLRFTRTPTTTRATAWAAAWDNSSTDESVNNEDGRRRLQTKVGS